MYKFIKWDEIDLKGKTNGQAHIPCPICDKPTRNKDTALSVNISKGVGRCHRCESVVLRDEKNKVEQVYQLPDQTWENHTKISDRVVKWFKSERNITQRTLIDCKITEQSHYFPQKNKKLNSICFNYFDDNILVSTKFRSGDKDFSQSANTKKIFYGLNDIKSSNEIIIVEGEIDKLSFWEADIKNVISVPNGANDLDLFKDNDIFKDKHIVIAVDNDLNGIKLEKGILEIFGSSTCSKIKFNEGCKDANDVIVKFNTLELEKCYNNKIKYSVLSIKDYLFDMNDVNKKMEDFLTGKTKRGYKIGVDAFDNHFSFKENEFYVLTGKKGSGKTSLFQSIQIMGSVVNDLIWVVAFQENDKWAMKLNYMNYLLGDSARDVIKTNPNKYKIVSDWVDKHFYFLKVETIKDALDVTKTLINDLDINVYGLLLDPINSFKSGYKESGNGYSDGVDTALKILNFSLENCSVFINQHPTMSAQRQQGAVSSYQGEGGWFLNKASFTFVIHRENGSNENSLIVENVRNKHTGGEETDPENPIILTWSYKGIDISYLDNTFNEVNVIQKLIAKHIPFKITREDVEKIEKPFFDELDNKKELPKEDVSVFIDYDELTKEKDYVPF